MKFLKPNRWNIVLTILFFYPLFTFLMVFVAGCSPIESLGLPCLSNSPCSHPPPGYPCGSLSPIVGFPLFPILLPIIILYLLASFFGWVLKTKANNNIFKSSARHFIIALVITVPFLLLINNAPINCNVPGTAHDNGHGIFFIPFHNEDCYAFFNGSNMTIWDSASPNWYGYTDTLVSAFLIPYLLSFIFVKNANIKLNKNR